MKTYLSIIVGSIFITPLISQVLVNEYSASNLSGYTDNYEKEEDWIELYNTGAASVDLGGYYLSDDTDNPTKWVIPAGTNISANGFRTFWCSGRDESVINSIHTNLNSQKTRLTISCFLTLMGK